jgi:hypothetical protein
MKTMRKALALGALVGLVIAAGAPDRALAAPTPRNTLKLSRDRGAGAVQVTVQLQGSIFGPNIGAPITLSCGPDSLSGLKSQTIVDTNPGVGFASIQQGTWTTALGTGGCFGGGVLPLKFPCGDANGGGATLVVR